MDVVQIHQANICKAMITTVILMAISITMMFLEEMVQGIPTALMVVLISKADTVIQMDNYLITALRIQKTILILIVMILTNIMMVRIRGPDTNLVPNLDMVIK